MQNPLISLLSRVWKYRLHYILVIPALIMIGIFKIVPLINDIKIAFSEFSVFKGVWESPWVGFENFRVLFEEPGFQNALTNTLAIKLMYTITCGVVALLVALALNGIQSGKLRSIFATLFLIPYFIPSLIFAYIVMVIVSPSTPNLFPVHTLILSDSDLFRPLIVSVEIVKTCGIPILMALAAISYKQVSLEQNGGLEVDYWRGKFIPAVRAVIAFMILQLPTWLSTDFELIHQLVNPLVYDVGDTLNTYQYRTGFMNLNLQLAGASWLFQFVVQLLFTWIAYLVIRRFFLKDLFGVQSGKSKWITKSGGNPSPSIVVVLLYSLIVLLPLYVLFVHPYTMEGTSDLRLFDVISARNFLVYICIYIFAIMMGLLFTLTLAYPLTVKDLPGRGLYKGLLLLVMGIGSVSFSQYLLVRELNMINTVPSLVLFGFYSIAGVFVIKSIFNRKFGLLMEQARSERRGEGNLFFTLFIPKVWKPLLALGILQFVTLWNSYYSAILYLNNREIAPPLMQLLTFVNQSPERFSDPVFMMIAALISIPPIVLLLIFRRWLTSEVLLNQFNKL